MKSNRKSSILEFMKRNGGSANVIDLCQEFDVSDMTIRRDLIALEEEKQVLRHHGGASLAQASAPAFHDAPFQIRLENNHEQKVLLGKFASEYLQRACELQNCKSVYIASGTSLYCMAQQIDFPMNGITLVTDNVPIAQVLTTHPDYTVISIGGQLILPSLNAVGHVAESMIRSFTYDYAFISAASIDDQGIIYNYNYIEAGTFTAVLESSRKIVVVADSSKFGKKTFVQLCQLKKDDVLITDSGISHDFHDFLLSRNVQIKIADPFTSGGGKA